MTACSAQPVTSTDCPTDDSSTYWAAASAAASPSLRAAAPVRPSPSRVARLRIAADTACGVTCVTAACEDTSFAAEAGAVCGDSCFVGEAGVCGDTGLATGPWVTGEMFIGSSHSKSIDPWSSPSAPSTPRLRALSRHLCRRSSRDPSSCTASDTHHLPSTLGTTVPINKEMRPRAAFDHNTLVAWAAGTVVAQMNCTLDQAVALMEQRATETSRTLDDIAVDVVERRIRFGK